MRPYGNQLRSLCLVKRDKNKTEERCVCTSSVSWVLVCVFLESTSPSAALHSSLLVKTCFSLSRVLPILIWNSSLWVSVYFMFLCLCLSPSLVSRSSVIIKRRLWLTRHVPNKHDPQNKELKRTKWRNPSLHGASEAVGSKRFREREGAFNYLHLKFTLKLFLTLILYSLKIIPDTTIHSLQRGQRSQMTQVHQGEELCCSGWRSTQIHSVCISVPKIAATVVVQCRISHRTHFGFVSSWFLQRLFILVYNLSPSVGYHILNIWVWCSQTY